LPILSTRHIYWKEAFLKADWVTVHVCSLGETLYWEEEEEEEGKVGGQRGRVTGEC